MPEFDEWYLHLFEVTQADLNWENPEVRHEMAEIVNYWIDKGVRGFRFDVVNLLSKSEYADDPNNFYGRRFYTDGPRIHEFLKELNMNSFGQVEKTLTVGEMSSTSLDNCVRYSGADSHELNMVFTFHHLKVDYKNKKKWELMPYNFMELKYLLSSWQLGMQEKDAWNALFFNNHDQPRAISRFTDDERYHKESCKMLAIALHMMRGTPYIYQGEEIGMINAYLTDISQYRDVESTIIYNIMIEQGRRESDIYKILQERSRDNSRTPMQWTSEDEAGFTTGTPWLAVNKNHDHINVEASLKDTDSVFYTYQKLIKLRKQYKVIQEGSFIPLLEDHFSIFPYKQKNICLQLICNFNKLLYKNHLYIEGDRRNIMHGF